MRPFPIILVGRDYWAGLVDWIVKRMLEEGYISEDELDLFKLVDSSQEAAELIMQHINRAACEPESESEPDPETSA